MIDLRSGIIHILTLSNMSKENLKGSGGGSLSVKHVAMQLVAGGSAGIVEVLNINKKAVTLNNF